MTYTDAMSNNAGNIGAFRKLKEQHKHLTLALSLGGWTKSTYFSDCAKVCTSRMNELSKCARSHTLRGLRTGLDEARKTCAVVD